MNLSGLISYKQVEELLSLYSKFVGLLNSLQVELQAAYIENSNEEEEDDVIYALVVGNRRFDGLPKPPYSVSDKTWNVAFIYKRVAINGNRPKIKRLSHEILEVNTIIEKIDIAINSLGQYQQKIIDHICFKGTPLDKFASYSVAEERKVRQEKRKALESMSKIMRITEEEFYKVISKVR